MSLFQIICVALFILSTQLDKMMHYRNQIFPLVALCVVVLFVVSFFI